MVCHGMDVMMADESRLRRDRHRGMIAVSQLLRLAVLLLPVLGACERAPAPILDRAVQRGTALPPPDLADPPRR